MTDQPIKAYGEGRVRAGVSYAQVERAAITILKSERRPTVETVREVLGTGSPDTIALALKRFWRDLGARIEGDPAALTRMPGEIAELADGMWQQALNLAGEAAAHDDNAARERLRQLELENEIKKRSFDLREQEIDTQARQRERALADARDHLLSLSKLLSREQATNAAQARRIADLEAQTAQYREELAKLIAAIAQSRPRPRPVAATSTASRPGRRKSTPATRRDNPAPPKRKIAKKSAAPARRRASHRASRRRTR